MDTSDPRDSRLRRSAAVLAAALALGLLTACQTSPPPHLPAPHAARSTQLETVRALGFTESAEGGWLINLSEAIVFGVDRDELTPEMQVRIAQMARELLRADVRRLRVEGHTDRSGARAYNVELSRRRAEVVAQAFIANGFAPDAVERRGLGYDFPIASNATAEGRARNRRVTVMVASEEIAMR
jgi:outer membrane protein OmpA-like peptidoglycan-associated protein